MVSPDVNVLVAYWRPDHPHHAFAKAWMEDGSSRGRGMQVFPIVAAAFLRLVTHPRVFTQPSTAKEANAFLQNFLETTDADVPDIGRATLERCQALCTELDIRGSKVSDALIAAAVLEHDSHLVTFDRDFVKLLPASRLTLLNTR